MSNRVSKIFQYLRGKLYSFLGFVKFLVVPQSRMMKITMIGSFVFFVFVFGHFAFAGLGDQIIGIINVLLYYIAFALGWVAMKIFALIIWVSQYNDFVTSPAVDKGWVLIRDVCNMFFVVILLVIAFAQILGVQKYSMKTMLPKVLIAAILVNFSKLLCGLMIDLAQVVMMTFVNGYQATAGANLINGLGLTKLLKLNDSAREGNPGGGGVDASQITLALVIAIFIIIATIFVSFFIAVLLLLRIVTLWILVVLSPAAFALSTVPFGQGKYNEWWQKFGWNVAVGPFMAFFLWLSLLIMSNPQDMMGSNTNLTDAQSAINEGSGTSSGATTYLDNLAQAAIGLAMLFASLVIAQEAGGAMASLASKGQKVTAGALKGVAMRASGAKAVTDRGRAIGAGWKERSQAKQQAKMAKYKRAGARAQGMKEAGLQRLKRAPLAPIDAIKGGRSEATMDARRDAYKKAQSAALKGGASAKEAAKAGRKASRKVLRQKIGEQLDTGLRTGRVGSLEATMAGAAGKDAKSQALEESKKSFEARGISKKEDLEAILARTGLPGIGKLDQKEQRQAAIALADKGMMTQETAARAEQVLAGDPDAMKAYKTALKKKQAHLAYETEESEDGRRVLTDKSKKELRDDIKAGDVDATKLSEDAYADPEIMGVMRDTLGAKRFQKTMEKVKDRGVDYETNVNDSMHGMLAGSSAEAQLAQKKAEALNEGDEGFEEAQSIAAAAQKAFEDLEVSVSKITGNAQNSFAVRDATGSIGTNVRLDQTTLARLATAVGGGRISGKEIKDFKMDPDEAGITSGEKENRQKILQEVSGNISVNQLSEMGQHANLNVVVKQMVESGSGNLEQLASNEKVMGAITDSDVLDKLQEIKAQVEQRGTQGQVEVLGRQQSVMEEIRDSLVGQARESESSGGGRGPILGADGRPVGGFG